MDGKLSEFGEQFLFLSRKWCDVSRSGFNSIQCGVFVILIIREIIIGFLDLSLPSGSIRALGCFADRACMFFNCGGKCCRRRKQTFLEEFEHELGGEMLTRCG